MFISIIHLKVPITALIGLLVITISSGSRLLFNSQVSLFNMGQCHYYNGIGTATHIIRILGAALVQIQ
jgi:hypothetical protein